MESTIATIASVLLVLLFYGYFFFTFSKRIELRNSKKRFFHSVLSTLQNNQNNADCIEQLDINFKKIRERNPNLSKELRTTTDLLEDMFHDYDIWGEKGFKKSTGLDMKSDIRNRLIKIIEEMKLKNPFLSLPPEDASLLSDLTQAIDTSNKELGMRTIRQLAGQLKIKDSNFRIQEKRNNTAFVVAAIGVVLTLFFGIVSLALFLAQRSS